ncbi:MAG: hypothetical protein JWP66_1851 [Naasia sp.]|nr:hypothetical protein [Naasia sp.]
MTNDAVIDTATDVDNDVSVFDDEVEVDDKPQRVWPLVAALVAIGLAFGGITAAVVTVGTPAIGFVVSLFNPASRVPVVSTASIEDAMDVSIAAGAVSELPREQSVYIVGQVRFDGVVDPAFTGDGFVELFDVPPSRVRDWNDELENVRYFITGDGRSVLVGTNEGDTVAVFSLQ